MGNDGTAVGDELLGVPLPFGFFGLQAENLKGRGAAAAHRGDGWTAASIVDLAVQRQSVEGIRAVATLKGCVNGIDASMPFTQPFSVATARIPSCLLYTSPSPRD